MDNINIIQLPEQIFREIFRYLDNKTIIFSLRNVCIKIREYVDRYIDISNQDQEDKPTESFREKDSSSSRSRLETSFNNFK